MVCQRIICFRIMVEQGNCNHETKTVGGFVGATKMGGGGNCSSYNEYMNKLAPMY